MSRILGLDLGTNSIGWAIVDEKSDGEYNLVDKGVTIFQEGVKYEKGVESSKAAERTSHRATRRHYFRRKLRKIEVIKVLVENNLSPYVSTDSLNDWRYKRIYPLVDDFILWQRTDDNQEKNPYHDRYVCLTQKLDLSQKKDRYILGRAFYHLAQRRGFLSNRLEKTKESDGEVKKGIESLNKKIEESGCQYLGEYFYSIYGKERIRQRYTARFEYEKEFNAICSKQELSKELREQLHRAIFFQRPLKSQKGTVGKCKFEKSKSRIPISHPRFEEFRMYSFINNIKVKTPEDNELRPLTDSEKSTILPLFFRKSKKTFEFEDIAKKFTPRKNSYAFYKDRDANSKPFLFNYPMYTSVSGCPMISQLRDLLGEHWKDCLVNNYKLKKDKTKEQIINDIWHVLFTFDSEDLLQEWAVSNLAFSEEQAEAFANISVPQDYASLSLNAISKMLPYLKRGLKYSHSVYLANMSEVLPATIWENEENRQIIEKEIISIIEDRDAPDSIERRIEEFLKDNFDVDTLKMHKMYHPSQIDVFEKITDNKELKLGSPRTSSVRNPMAMRALFRLRSLINTLLAEGQINRNTKIHIEFARELNDANRRKAIEQYQREREKENDKFRKAIKEHFTQEGIKREPNDLDILKYRLWEEQQHICLYTGDTICFSDFLGSNPKYDIEHTIPRSIGGEDALENLTLCSADFNRNIKKNKLPQQLDNIDSVIERIEQNTPYKQEHLVTLKEQIEKLKGGGFASKEVKDRVIQKKRRLELEYQYLTKKREKFFVKELIEGYRKSQDRDNSVIAKYGREYLNTLFYTKVTTESGVITRSNVYTIKGVTTAEFRKLWGLQGEWQEKDRSKFSNHTVDAIVIACIGLGAYQKMAQYCRLTEEGTQRPEIDKPWKTFTEDLRNIDKDILVYHYTPDNTIKQTFKKLRKRGIIQKNGVGADKYMRGDSVRAQLHLDTFYGAIKRGDQIKYVVRRPLNSLEKKDIDNIVDEIVREKVNNAINEYGLSVLSGGKVWMNEDKGIEIKKVRLLVPSVTNPINLKRHRDLSQFDYKQNYFVANDTNYCMAIYEGEVKGKLKREFEIINNLDAAKIAKLDSNKRVVLPPSKKGLSFKCLYKTGTLVLIYDQDKNELKEYDNRELSKRLYKIIGMKADGRVKLRHHMESRVDDQIKEDYSKNNDTIAPKILTTGYSSFDVKSYQPYLLLSKMSHNFLVEHYDFELTPSGKIKFIERQSYD